MGNLPSGNEYEITMTGYGARIFKRCVDHELERWPGGDPDEQIYLDETTDRNKRYCFGRQYGPVAMNICGWQIDPAAQAAIFGFALTLASEVIGMSKLKENSLLQLVLGVARRQVTPPAPLPSPAPSAKSPESPSPAKRGPGRPRGSTSARSSRAKASK